MRTPEEVQLDISEAVAESGIGVGTWGNIKARMAIAIEIEARMWEQAYRELYAATTKDHVADATGEP